MARPTWRDNGEIPSDGKASFETKIPDFEPLLSRAVAGLTQNTGGMRRALYDRARDALAKQLLAVDPALTGPEKSRQRLALDAAIRRVEANYVSSAAATSAGQDSERRSAVVKPTARAQQPRVTIGNAERPLRTPAPTWPADHSQRRGAAARETVPVNAGVTYNTKSLLRLPSALADRWQIVDEIEGSSQAHVLLVINNDGERRVAKIYHSKDQPKTEVLQRIGGVSFEHVVRLFEHGQSDGHWYELLEYVESGSLADLITREGPKLPEARVREILVELATAIHHLHEHDLVHRDIKPSNVLVRSLQPLDLVLADFGIASRLQGATRHQTSLRRTPEYAALETSGGEVSRASDWWSVGIILIEMLNGRHPFFEWFDDDADTAHKRITSQLAYLSMDKLVEGIAEPWRILCRGLLRRQPKNRWGYSEIRRWLDGDRTLRVADEAAPTIREHPPFFFAGQKYETLPEIGRALAGNWSEARKVVERGHLLNWVKDDLKDNEWRQFLSDLDRDCDDLDERVFRIILKLCPGMDPVYCGYALDANGLRSLAEDAEAGRNDASFTLRRVLGRGILNIAAASTGVSELKQLHDALSSSQAEYETLCSAIGSAGAPTIPAENDLTRAAILRSLLPDGALYLASLRDRADCAASADARDCPWFRKLVDAGGNPIAALLLMPLVASAAEKETRERRKRKEEEAKQRKYDTIYNTCRDAAGISAGLLAGIAAGFIPCWIFTGIVGAVGGASAGWGWYAFLMIIFGIGGAIGGQQFAKENAWLASANRDPNEPLLGGVFAAIVGLIVVGGLTIYWINLAQRDITLAEAKQHALVEQQRLNQLRAQEQQRAFAEQERLRAQEQQRQMALSMFKRAGIARDAFNNNRFVNLVDEGSVLQGPKTSLVAWIGYDPNRSYGAKLTMTLVWEGGQSPPCTSNLFNGGAWGSFSNEFKSWCKWEDVGPGDYRVRIQINDQLVSEPTAKVLP